MLKLFTAWLLLAAALLYPISVLACEQPASVCRLTADDRFALIHGGHPAWVIADPGADPAVRRVADALALDLGRAGGTDAPRADSIDDATGPVVFIGVVGNSPVIDALASEGKLDTSSLAGRWEAFQVAVVEAPWPGVARALVIAGADRRGAVFGAYDLAGRIGVSPWYWFADVPVRRRDDVFVTPGVREDAPGVRYRGIFINDENPAFSSWAEHRFGGINADLYERVFELILRLKGNTLWPAMWAPKAFHLDDERNATLADEMGIVMGTSHHEPLTRAQAEWHRLPDDPSTGGAWNYATNAENLRAFWRGGMQRLAKADGGILDNLVTVGMRGDGDEPMSEDTAIELLETVVADQRRIIAETTGRPAAQTPQVWALYKEVQDYYDQGMTVPDDVTLLFADDNWGQIRRLPVDDLKRAGGFGVYYHYDYVGGPRSYKWLNTTQLGKVWQQMNLAWERGARRLWVVNVGDIKPMEVPIDFWMKMAWDPEAMTVDALSSYPAQWAARQFGPSQADAIGELVTRYARLASRRKPELVDESAFPIGRVDGEHLVCGDFGRRVREWQALVTDMEAVRTALPSAQGDAFFQLVEFPIRALANLYEMHWATAWNRRLASSFDARANYFLRLVERNFARDAELTATYHALRDGKWNGMVAGVHMNYVIWSTPTQQTMPTVMGVGADTPVDLRDLETVFVDDEPRTAARVLVDIANPVRHAAGAGLEWTLVPDLGDSGVSLVALPQGRAATTPRDGVRVDYTVALNESGDWRVILDLAPTLEPSGEDDIRVGVSLDDGPVQVLTSRLIPTAGAVTLPEQADWTEAVIRNSHQLETTFSQVDEGEHTVTLWRLDDNAVIQGITLDRAR